MKKMELDKLQQENTLLKDLLREVVQKLVVDTDEDGQSTHPVNDLWDMWERIGRALDEKENEQQLTLDL